MKSSCKFVLKFWDTTPYDEMRKKIANVIPHQHYIQMDEICLCLLLLVVWNFIDLIIISSLIPSPRPGENSMTEELNMIIIHFPECRVQSILSRIALSPKLLSKIKIGNCSTWLLHHAYGLWVWILFCHCHG